MAPKSKTKSRYTGLLSIKKSPSLNKLAESFMSFNTLPDDYKAQDDMFKSQLHIQIIKDNLNRQRNRSGSSIRSSDTYSDEDIEGPPELNDMDEIPCSNPASRSQNELLVEVTLGKPSVRIDSNELNAIFLELEQKKDILGQSSDQKEISCTNISEYIARQDQVRRAYAIEGTD